MRILCWSAALALVVIAACDDTKEVDGARGPCGFGGDLSACPASELTPVGACTRLVDCAAIPLDANDMGFDWGACVDEIEAMTVDRETFVIDCIAQATCDSLKTDGSPANGGHPYCFKFGGR